MALSEVGLVRCMDVSTGKVAGLLSPCGIGAETVSQQRDEPYFHFSIDPSVTSSVNSRLRDVRKDLGLGGV